MPATSPTSWSASSVCRRASSRCRRSPPGPPAGAARDVLIVFSQGLSPNARLALAAPAAWQRVLLATAVTTSGASRPGHEAKRALLDRLQRAGGLVCRFPEEDEGTTLVRVIGPMVGYLCALRIMQSLGQSLGASGLSHRPLPAIDIDALCTQVASAGSRLVPALAELICGRWPTSSRF